MFCLVPISAHSFSMKLLAAEKQPSIHLAPICTNVNDQKRKRERYQKTFAPDVFVTLQEAKHTENNILPGDLARPTQDLAAVTEKNGKSDLTFSLRALITQRLVNDTQL